MAKATLFTEANDLARSGNCWPVRLILDQWRDTGLYVDKACLPQLIFIGSCVLLRGVLDNGAGDTVELNWPGK